MQPKVFGIGFQKTGTSSLSAALTILGYRVKGWLAINRPDKVQRYVEAGNPITLEKLAAACIPIAQRYDAFEDNPWCLIFRELDAAFPGSKFILTRRKNPQAWVRSVAGHFGERQTPIMDFIYGAGRPPKGNEQLYLDRYLRHNAEVIDYFRDRPGDLLILETEKADWAPLCAFLGRSAPSLRPYPHANSAKSRQWNMRLRALRRMAAQKLQDAVRRLSRAVSV